MNAELQTSYSRFELASKYLHYYCTASNGKGHGIHSPFVFDFIIKVLKDKKPYEIYQPVEALRRELLADDRVMEVEDFGAGSSVSRSRLRSVASIARHAAKPSKWGQLLFRTARYFQPRSIVELGTSLGLSTAYLAAGSPEARVFSAEGSPSVAALARRHLHARFGERVVLTEGNFDDTLPQILAEMEQTDLAFIDGNHRREPTLRYFEQLLAKRQPGSVFIFDDIHWSAGMEGAWAAIKAHPEVRLTIDLFFIGLVFFRDEFRVKQDFTIRF